MKKLMLALCMLFGGVAFVNAQNQDQSTPSAQTETMDQDRQPIQASELPEAVRTQLQSADYSGWTVAQAYKGTLTDAADQTKSQEVYIVELRNGAETKAVTFDKDGNSLDKEQEDQK